MVILLTCSVIVYLAVCLLFLCVFAAVAREGRGSNQITSVSNKSRKMDKTKSFTRHIVALCA